MSVHQVYLQQFANHTRFSHIENDELQAALIDSNDPYRCGSIYIGRVQNVTPAFVWIDIGTHKPALLKCRNHQWHQGMKCIVRITRESQVNAYEDKGPQVVIDTTYAARKLDSDQQTVPRLLQAAQPAWLQYVNELTVQLALPLTIQINDLALFQVARGMINASLVKFILKQSDPYPQHVDDHWQNLLESSHQLNAGGHLLLQETRACNVIDLNTSGHNSDDASKPLTNSYERLKFNQLSMPQILRLINLRALTGTIFMDFLRLNDWKLQQQLLVSLRQQAKVVKDLRILGFTPGGWIEACRTVTGPSLKDKADIYDK